jgi:hypothetical protein
MLTAPRPSPDVYETSEIAGDLASMLMLSSGNKKPVIRGDDGLQVTLVAGTRNHLYRTSIHLSRPGRDQGDSLLRVPD